MTRTSRAAQLASVLEHRDRSWGYELPFANVPERYAGTVAFVREGARLTAADIEGGYETMCTLSGQARFELVDSDGRICVDECGPGFTVDFAARAFHRLTALTDLTVVRVWGQSRPAREETDASHRQRLRSV